MRRVSVTCFYRNRSTSGILGDLEMLWEHEPTNQRAYILCAVFYTLSPLLVHGRKLMNYDARIYILHCLFSLDKTEINSQLGWSWCDRRYYFCLPYSALHEAVRQSWDHVVRDNYFTHLNCGHLPIDRRIKQALCYLEAQYNGREQRSTDYPALYLRVFQYFGTSKPY